MTVIDTPLTHTGTTIALPTPGVNYSFQISALNVHGEGPNSTIVTIKASSKPAQISTVVLSESNVNTKVRITWNVPNDNYDTITAYNIYLLQKSTEQFKIFTWICNGA